MPSPVQDLKNAATDAEAQAEATVSATRTEARSWMADHPFEWGFLCLGIGAALGVAAGLAVL